MKKKRSIYSKGKSVSISKKKITPPKKRADKSKQKKKSIEKVTWKPGTMIYPLPAVMVSCGAKEEEYNIITVSWTGITCTDPAMCYISIRPERHSYLILKKNKEYCINLTTRELAFATDFCGVRSGRDINKFEAMKLTPLPAPNVKAPMIGESPVNIECRIVEIKKLGTHHLFLSKIIAVHASKVYLNPKTDEFDLSLANPISYLHGKYYDTGKCIGKFGFSVKKKKRK